VNSYLTPGQAADRYRLSTNYLKKLRCLGGGPRYAKIGRKIVYDTADVEEWFEARKVASTSDAAVRVLGVA